MELGKKGIKPIGKELFLMYFYYNPPGAGKTSILDGISLRDYL
jgi:hypothetical protein